MAVKIISSCIGKSQKNVIYEIMNNKYWKQDTRKFIFFIIKEKQRIKIYYKNITLNKAIVDKMIN